MNTFSDFAMRIACFSGICAFASAMAEKKDSANYIELQAVRYTYSSVNYKTTAKTGETNSFDLHSSKLKTFPSKILFVGHSDLWAFSLQRNTESGESAYVSAGYGILEGCELGLGTNLTFQSDDQLQSDESIQKNSTTAYFAGPYIRIKNNLDFATLEYRVEIDLGSIVDERLAKGKPSQKLSDVIGLTVDHDVSLAFELSKNLTYVTGVNLFYQALKDRAPAGTLLSDKKRIEWTWGVQLANLRFKF